MGNAVSFDIEKFAYAPNVAPLFDQEAAAARPTFLAKGVFGRVRKCITTLPQLIADVAYLNDHIAPLYADPTGRVWRFEVLSRVSARALRAMVEDGMSDDGEGWSRCNNVIVSATLRKPFNGPADEPESPYSPLEESPSGVGSVKPPSGLAALRAFFKSTLDLGSSSEDDDSKRKATGKKSKNGKKGSSAAAGSPPGPFGLRPAEFYAVYLFAADNSVSLGARAMEAVAAAADKSASGMIEAPSGPVADAATGAVSPVAGDGGACEAVAGETRGALAACLPATNNKNNNDEEEEEETQGECNICLCARVDVVLPCSHAFCEACINDWTARQPQSCPVCRSAEADAGAAWALLDDAEGKDELLAALCARLAAFIKQRPLVAVKDAHHNEPVKPAAAKYAAAAAPAATAAKAPAVAAIPAAESASLASFEADSPRPSAEAPAVASIPAPAEEPTAAAPVAAEEPDVDFTPAAAGAGAGDDDDDADALIAAVSAASMSGAAKSQPAAGAPAAAAAAAEEEAEPATPASPPVSEETALEEPAAAPAGGAGAGKKNNKGKSKGKR